MNEFIIITTTSTIIVSVLYFLSRNSYNYFMKNYYRLLFFFLSLTYLPILWDLLILFMIKDFKRLITDESNIAFEILKSYEISSSAYIVLFSISFLCSSSLLVLSTVLKKINN